MVSWPAAQHDGQDADRTEPSMCRPRGPTSTDSTTIVDPDTPDLVRGYRPTRKSRMFVRDDAPASVVDGPASARARWTSTRMVPITMVTTAAGLAVEEVVLQPAEDTDLGAGRLDLLRCCARGRHPVLSLLDLNGSVVDVHENRGHEADDQVDGHDDDDDGDRLAGLLGDRAADVEEVGVADGQAPGWSS